jgi:hypothetical protein
MKTEFADETQRDLQDEINALKTSLLDTKRQLYAHSKLIMEALELQRQIDLLKTVIRDLRNNGTATIVWIKAADAALLGGGISLNQLRSDRRNGIIPLHGWRKKNSRVYEYRQDIICSLFLHP